MRDSEFFGSTRGTGLSGRPRYPYGELGVRVTALTDRSRLKSRKELCRQRQELEVRKKALIENISARKKFLASLPSQLKGLKRASVSLQMQLGVHHKKRVKQNHLAELLPPPLYVIYSQLIAYKDAFADSIEAEILGSAKEAEALMRLQASREVGLHLIPAVTTTAAGGELGGGGGEGAGGGGGGGGEGGEGGGGGGGGEDEAMEGEEAVDRHKRATKGKDTLMAANAEQVYRAHPLTVVLNIFEENAEGGKDEMKDKQKKLVGVVFEYLPRLKVVCAAVSPGEGGGDEKMLGNLFPDDTGADTPNQATKLYLDGTFTFDPSRPSRPYKWAQHLAGMDFLPIVPPSLLPDDKAGAGSAVRGVNGEVLLAGFSAYREQHRVHNVIQQLRARKRAQQALK
ncbi:hypothetical protein CBR_g24409 [Chara braunii]|uniref:Uncharacterized protein n=1 Tax=Chara braunii TaxID=69332 RepID=A0A388JMS7_CHABU|nr:hypothetical protein CBR_g24409 [Chara braunii]|eukprot:GBG59065.1 hypothetical protein CBR_g24409 [Chara braunii]